MAKLIKLIQISKLNLALTKLETQEYMLVITLKMNKKSNKFQIKVLQQFLTYKLNHKTLNILKSYIKKME
jgi:hypothetical protein